jgi:hypothetical protein
VQRRLRIQAAVVRSTGGASAEAPEDTGLRARPGHKENRLLAGMTGRYTSQGRKKEGKNRSGYQDDSGKNSIFVAL